MEKSDWWIETFPDNNLGRYVSSEISIHSTIYQFYSVSASFDDECDRLGTCKIFRSWMQYERTALEVLHILAKTKVKKKIEGYNTLFSRV